MNEAGMTESNLNGPGVNERSVNESGVNEPGVQKSGANGSAPNPGASGSHPDNSRTPGNPQVALLDSLEQAGAASSHSRTQLWMHRTSVFLFVLICAVAGVLLIILPWTPEWAENSLLTSYPGARVVVESGFVRGLFSGLGLLDIWIGFWEALHYREPI